MKVRRVGYKEPFELNEDGTVTVSDSGEKANWMVMQRATAECILELERRVIILEAKLVDQS